MSTAPIEFHINPEARILTHVNVPMPIHFHFDPRVCAEPKHFHPDSNEYNITCTADHRYMLIALKTGYAILGQMWDQELEGELHIDGFGNYQLLDGHIKSGKQAIETLYDNLEV